MFLTQLKMWCFAMFFTCCFVGVSSTFYHRILFEGLIVVFCWGLADNVAQILCPYPIDFFVWQASCIKLRRTKLSEQTKITCRHENLWFFRKAKPGKRGVVSCFGRKDQTRPIGKILDWSGWSFFWFGTNPLKMFRSTCNQPSRDSHAVR